MLEQLFIDALFCIRFFVRMICGLLIPFAVMGAFVGIFMDDVPWWWIVLSLLSAVVLYAIRHYYDAFLAWLTDPIEPDQERDQAAD